MNPGSWPVLHTGDGWDLQRLPFALAHEEHTRGAGVQRFEEAERRVTSCAEAVQLPYTPRAIEILAVNGSLLPLPYFAYRQRFG